MAGRLRQVRLAPLGVGLVLICASACSAAPGWLGARNAAVEPLEYPDLAEVPARPAPAITPDQRQEIAQSLEADRARLAQAAESLRREIETSFETPEPPAGP